MGTLRLGNSLRDKVASVVPYALRKRIGRRLRPARPPTPGPPPGLAPQVIEDVCRDRIGESPASVTHLQISGWRIATTGAFRVEVVTLSGRPWSFFYKNAVLTVDATPGLRGLPHTPGSEVIVYSRPTPQLLKIIAQPYHVEPIGDRLHYRIVLEDVKRSGWAVPSTDKQVLAAVLSLADVHTTLNDWAAELDGELYEYPRSFSTELRRLCRPNLERYLEVASDPSVVRLIGEWDTLEEVHEFDPAHDREMQTVVHGDANRANYLIRDDGTVKIVDWEWCGWRVPHYDLASLIKSRSPSFVERALGAFAEKRPQLSPDEHRRLYLWARLEMRLVDATYVAAQKIGAPGTSRMDLDRYLHVSVQEILDSLQQMEAAQ